MGIARFNRVLTKNELYVGSARERALNDKATIRLYGNHSGIHVSVG